LNRKENLFGRKNNPEITSRIIETQKFKNNRKIYLCWTTLRCENIVPITKIDLITNLLYTNNGEIMDAEYFSDRELGQKARTIEEIPKNVWGGLVYLIETGIKKGAYGKDFPEYCPDYPDGNVITGVNVNEFSSVLGVEVPSIEFPLNSEEPPDTITILDVIEFCYKHVVEPKQMEFHSYWGHYHLNLDIKRGQEKFRNTINGYFQRNGLAYELKKNGRIERLTSPVLHGLLKSAIFNTGDNDLDELLELAKNKIFHPDLKVRKESLEKLWDAWERLKTLEPGKDKRESTKKILDKAQQEPEFRDLLEKEAMELTNIGNKFRIRHSETDKIPINDNQDIDYLFHRMFSLIWIILVKIGKVKIK